MDSYRVPLSYMREVAFRPSMNDHLIRSARLNGRTNGEVQMRHLVASVLFFVFLFAAAPAKAWNCSDSLAERVPVPAGTSGTFGSGDGQLFLGVAGEGVAGQLYKCEVVPVGTTPPAGTLTNTNTGTNSNTNNNSSSSKSDSNSTSTAINSTNVKATGGASSSTATGGTSSVNNSGNSTSTSSATGGSVKDSGNSTAVATGGQGGQGGNSNQKQGQSQSQSATASDNGNGNGNNSNNSVYNAPRQTATAYAPSVYPTVPCFKGFGAGAQGPAFGASFGGGKIDQNCAALEASRQAPSLIARCKVYISIKVVKAAGVTLEDCLAQPEPRITVEQGPATVAEPRVSPITFVIPAPVIMQTILAPPPVVPATVPAPPVPVVHQRHKVKSPCVTNDDIDRKGPPTNKQ